MLNTDPVSWEYIHGLFRAAQDFRFTMGFDRQALERSMDIRVQAVPSMVLQAYFTFSRFKDGPHRSVGAVDLSSALFRLTDGIETDPYETVGLWKTVNVARDSLGDEISKLSKAFTDVGLNPMIRVPHTDHVIEEMPDPLTLKPNQLLLVVNRRTGESRRRTNGNDKVTGYDFWLVASIKGQIIPLSRPHN